MAHIDAPGGGGCYSYQHSALKLQIPPRPTRTRGQDPPMRSDQALLGELNEASRWILAVPAGTRKARPLVEIRLNNVGCCCDVIVPPAQGLCHRSLFEEKDLGSYQDSLCFMVVLAVSKVLVVIGL